MKLIYSTVTARKSIALLTIERHLGRDRRGNFALWCMMITLLPHELLL